jgi:hypothetical protein
MVGPAANSAAGKFAGFAHVLSHTGRAAGCARGRSRSLTSRSSAPLRACSPRRTADDLGEPWCRPEARNGPSRRQSATGDRPRPVQACCPAGGGEPGRVLRTGSMTHPCERPEDLWPMRRLRRRWAREEVVVGWARRFRTRTDGHRTEGLPAPTPAPAPVRFLCQRQPRGATGSHAVLDRSAACGRGSLCLRLARPVLGRSVDGAAFGPTGKR